MVCSVIQFLCLLFYINVHLKVEIPTSVIKKLKDEMLLWLSNYRRWPLLVYNVVSLNSVRFDSILFFPICLLESETAHVKRNIFLYVDFFLNLKKQ